jgi:outer membrane immunogenic protein
MMATRGWWAGTFLMCGAVPAFAADLPRAVYKSPPQLAAVYNWTGFYFAAGGGYAAYSDSNRPLTIGGLSTGHAASAGGAKGGFGTVAAGFDYQFADRFVAGVFADYDFSDIKGQSMSFVAGVTSRGLESAWSAGGRLGFLVSPATMLYISGGYTSGDFSGGPQSSIFLANGGNGSVSSFRSGGGFAGAGVEALLAPNWSARLEYRYASYDSERATRFNLAGVPVGLTEVAPDVQTIRASIAYRFGVPGIGAVTTPAPAAPAYSWTGLYIGGGGGYGGQTYNSAITSSLVPMKPYDSGAKGALATVVAGYDYQFADRWVAGVFADYDFVGSKGDYPTYFFDQFNVGSLKQTSAWAVGGRLGYLVMPQTLFYGTGGYTQTKFDSAVLTRSTLASSPTEAVIPAQTYEGWFLGAGVENQLSSNWYARLEYRYAQYDREQLLSPNPPTLVVNTIDFRPTSQTVRVGVSYKFGPGGPVVAKY